MDPHFDDRPARSGLRAEIRAAMAETGATEDAADTDTDAISTPALEIGDAVIEPACAAHCAMNPERHAAVVPQLRELNREARAVLPDRSAPRRPAGPHALRSRLRWAALHWARSRSSTDRATAF